MASDRTLFMENTKLDFLKVIGTSTPQGKIEIQPLFVICNSKDLMIRGKDFYAIWVESRGLWSTDEADAMLLIDSEVDRIAKEKKQADELDGPVRVLHMWNSRTGVVDAWHKYCQKQMWDNFHMLDEKLMFSNVKASQKDYASKRLSYPLEKGDYSAYDKLISTLYSEEERHKIEWAIGSIVSGDSKKLQKFMVLYGAPSTGKSTIIDIIELLFEGYTSAFDARALGNSSNSFALEAFKSNPLVAIQHDGDLSHIEDNARLNSVVSHELMTVNEKFKSTYANRFKAFLFMATNKPVKITDAKSGLLRRLIDVTPTGNLVPRKEYDYLKAQVKFELGAIAYHCLEVYNENPAAYNNYVPTAMLGATNDFYNFVLDSYLTFAQQDGTTLKAAWEMYKNYCDEARVPYPMSQKAFKEELKSYFEAYDERITLEDGSRPRNWYSGFKIDKFIDSSKKQTKKTEEATTWLEFRKRKSIFDTQFAECKAQYANEAGTPEQKWSEVTTTLADLDTSRMHYVLTPTTLVTVDFDIPDENGNKSFEKNLAAATKWPPTYAELSKSGAGIHLEYFYTGDTSKVKNVYAEHIEIKVRRGNAALRRMLTRCNDLPIATINSGLPLKEEKMINQEYVISEKSIRAGITQNLNKEVHGFTKPSIDMIYKILDDAYKSGVKYDVGDMYQKVLKFAMGSSNQSDYCLKRVAQMKFKSDEPSENKLDADGPIVFYDVEVFPNLLLVNWKYAGEGKPVIRLINPKPADIEELLKMKLVGFNCRRYDNHILYACLIGKTNEEIYQISQKIVSGNTENGAFFGEAYNISYTDVYDFAATKQSLKKWEIQLNIRHKELGLPWDQPVPESMWPLVAEYCDNDVLATEAVFNACQPDFVARKILADLSGLTVNDTTRMHITKILVGNEKKPKHIYTDLATGQQFIGDTPIEDVPWETNNAFPGYEFKRLEDNRFHNMYRGTDVGFGGYVYAEPGMYRNVALLDVGNMHGASIIALNKFGEYTKNYQEIRNARMAVKAGIKSGDFTEAKKMLGGKLAPYLTSAEEADKLQTALKLVLNSTYGIAAATFENPLRDPKDRNNIIALRGALFMRTLQDEVQAKGFKVVHIKTDSIKIPDATPELIDYVIKFGEKYGYEFEHEATYERMCLVNDAVYIAKYDEFGERGKGGRHANQWTATGTQFQVPYVFKKLFSGEDIKFEDTCETKSVTKGAIYLDMNENLPDVSGYEKELDKIRKAKEPGNEAVIADLQEKIAAGHDYVFVGRVGLFCPIQPGKGGGELFRKQDEKYYAVTGTKGYRWLETEVVEQLGKQNDVDTSYYEQLCNEAITTIEKYGSFRAFTDAELPDWPLDEPLPF